VEGEINTVLTQAKTGAWDGKYIQVKLKLGTPQMGISDRIREAFHQRGGHVLSVEVDFPEQRQDQDTPIEDMQQPTEIFEQFYIEKFNKSPDERMRQTFAELLELVGKEQ